MTPPPFVAFLESHGFVLLLGFYLSMIAVERVLYAVSRPRAYDDANTLASMGTSALATAIEALVGLVLPFLLYVSTYDNFRLASPGFAWWTFAVAFLVHETAYHFDHWATHRIGFLWAFHQPHHSSERLYFSTAARGMAFGTPLLTILLLPAALAGVHPLTLAAVATLKNMFGIFNHTELVDKLGPLERWVMTPANHRVHHGRNPRYIDRNYGQVFVFWDRVFGTFEPETEKPEFGLVEPMTSNNPLRIHFDGWRWLFAKMRSAPDWRSALACLWRPPEWKPKARQAQEAIAAPDPLVGRSAGAPAGRPGADFIA
ncbi:MAG: sterol desaturase family protein [Parvularculaceae bacterium]